jgi:hypothetical protein
VSLISEGEKYQISAHGRPHITRTQTGSLPTASASSTDSTRNNALSNRSYSLVIRINFVYHSVSLRARLHYVMGLLKLSDRLPGYLPYVLRVKSMLVGGEEKHTKTFMP